MEAGIVSMRGQVRLRVRVGGRVGRVEAGRDGPGMGWVDGSGQGWSSQGMDSQPKARWCEEMVREANYGCLWLGEP